MQATAANMPYGWSSLAQFWKDNPTYAPTGIHSEQENTSALAKASGVKQFIMFASIEGSMMSVAHHIHVDDHDDAGFWFDNNPADQKKYDAVLDTIIPRFVNAL